MEKFKLIAFQKAELKEKKEKKFSLTGEKQKHFTLRPSTIDWPIFG